MIKENVWNFNDAPLFDSPFIVIKSLKYKYTEKDFEILKKQFLTSALLPCGAVLKRKIEFLAGRYCVKKCFESFLIEEKDMMLFSTTTGSPVWPSGFCGSISHSNGYAVAVLGGESVLMNIGIDIEQIVNRKTVGELESSILTEPEMNSCPNWLSDQEWFTLIFSAKESLYKLLNPLTGSFIDFKHAEIIKAIPQKYTFEILLTRTIPNNHNQDQPVYRGGTIFTGYFGIREDFIWTMIPLYTAQSPSLCIDR